MADTATTAPAGVSGVEPTTGTTGTADVKFVTPEDFEGFKSFLNKDLAGHRKTLGTLDAKIESVMQKLETLAPPAAATGHGKGDKDLPTAEISRELKALKDQLEQERKEKADALISTAVAEATSGTIKELQDVLRVAVRAGARVEKVNGENVVVVEGEDGPVRLTAEWVRKKHGDHWFPATGKPGTGIAGGGTAGASGVDTARAMNDQEYFEKNWKTGKGLGG